MRKSRNRVAQNRIFGGILKRLEAAQIRLNQKRKVVCWIIINGAHPFVSERELQENPEQRYASNYFFVFNKFLAVSNRSTRTIQKGSATRRAHTGFVDAEVRSGRYTEQDRQAWIDVWSQPGSTTAVLNYYRANHRNPPFNDQHPASTIPRSWSAKESRRVPSRPSSTRRHL